jgi:hypothetical protein
MTRWTYLFLGIICLATLVMPGAQGTHLQAKEPARSESLRSKPGFLFLELFTTHAGDYIRFLQTVARFHLVHEETGFAELRSEMGQVMISSGKGLPTGHPFYGKVLGHDQGVGVEIGIVVADVTAARSTALQFKGWSVTDIHRQPWGQSDFRVATGDGYYFRLTEPAR